ncbi:DNA topoisomerase III [Rubrobacter xylanophilus DSM 9941]|uniref:DNA topoisomerase n=1 Tax=Rubrobacter xylanophilus (strain DSM 9941 / JCM 11954 / NBRC 16129 / PRD-1) TaxID=266117 RepID=Q1AY08_RUBXD|nr:type IA DNA topoisomerase [Rubrobacter xylanophilus]ABG03720.1 DNA topoisomerase III [Rubrobacter xylanophilus DSM 9941]
MRLIVAEKPSVGRDIAGALGRHRREGDALVGSGWVVTWALGHLAELAPPDAYGAEYKRWSLQNLPILPERFRVRVNPRTRERFEAVRRWMRDPSVTEVVNACDAGREGELIFAYLYQLSRCEKPVRRLWVSSLTPEAIREGFGSLRDGPSMKPLEDAARSRAEADWIVGMNATRAYSVRFSRPGDVLSVGRVQTPTLRLLVEREREIEDFRPERFFTVHARFARDGKTYDGLWFREKESRLKEREAAEQIAEKVRGGTGVVKKAERRRTSERPPLLYDLTELQRNANARYGFTAERTLRAAQALYEERKLITYPRTSSRYLSGDMVGTLKRRVEAAGGLPELAPFAGRLLAAGSLPVGRRVVDDSKVTDHHAIVPTDRKPSGGLPPDEAKVYDLVARRFLAVFFPAARFENTTVVTEARGETFLSKGRVVLEAGWRELYPDGVGGRKEKEPPALPPVEAGQEWRVAKVGVKEGETKPPPRYSESALLGAMETAGKLVEDEELRQQMKDSGLGTPATRAAIIERLIKVGYVEREKKALVPTAKGRALISLLADSPLSSPEMTARWERRLARIERGEERRPDFMSDISGFAASVVEGVRRMEGEKIAAPGGGGEALGACPKCGSPVVETKKAYGCSAWRKTGCDFAIWKRVAGKRVSESQARQLLAKGRTARLKGFKSRAGKPFSAALVLDGEHRVRLEPFRG